MFMPDARGIALKSLDARGPSVSVLLVLLILLVCQTLLRIPSPRSPLQFAEDAKIYRLWTVLYILFTLHTRS